MVPILTLAAVGVIIHLVHWGRQIIQNLPAQQTGDGQVMVNHEPHSTVGCTTHIFKALIDYKWCSTKCQSLIWQSSNHSRNRKYYKTLSELPAAFISMLAVTVTDNGDIQVLSSQLLPLHCDCFTVSQLHDNKHMHTDNLFSSSFFGDTNVSFHTTNVASLNSGQETNIPASATHTH